MMYEIIPGLYQSGLWAAWQAEWTDAVDLVVSCTEVPMDIPWAIPCLRFPFIDGPTMPSETALFTVAQAAAAVIIDGRKILTHCAEGHNRSGLVNAAILVELGAVKSGGEAVDLIRSKVPGSLSNQTFVDFLNSLYP